MRHIGHFLFVVGLTACLPLSATAATSDPQPPDDSRVLLSPTRMPELPSTRHSVPASATVITARDIERSGATNIPELLSRYEGVIVQDQQGFGTGADSTVNLRVFNSSRTNALVVVDGVRQNRITGDEVHWQSIPIKDIDRIEIIRGGGGVVYGEGAFAGVINIITKHRQTRPIELEDDMEIGSFGWRQYHTAARGRMRGVSYGTSFTRRMLDGYREFSWSRNSTVTAHGGVELAPWSELSVDVLHSNDTTAFPGGLTNNESQFRRRQAVIARAGIFDDETDQVAGEFSLGPWEGLSGSLSAYWRDRTVDSLRSRLFTLTPSRGLSVRGLYDWAGDSLSSRLISGIDLTDDKATTGTRGVPPEDESNRHGYGLYVEETITLMDRLSLVGGLRYDHFRYEEAISFPIFEGTLRFHGLSPKVGLSYVLVPDMWSAFASYSRPFKAPNVDDFSAQVPDFAGNVDLQPQQADTYEIGTRVTHTFGEASATCFWMHTNDEILFNRISFQNQNFDTRRFGTELAARLHWRDRVRGSATYTFSRAEFIKPPFNNYTIPGIPEHLYNFSVGVSPIRLLWIDLDWQLVQQMFEVNDFTNMLPAHDYGVLNLRVQFGESNTRVYVLFQNLTNMEYSSFQSSNGSNASGAGQFPMPPFGVTGGVSVKF